MKNEQFSEMDTDSEALTQTWVELAESHANHTPVKPLLTLKKRGSKLSVILKGRKRYLFKSSLNKENNNWKRKTFQGKLWKNKTTTHSSRNPIRICPKKYPAEPQQH